MPEIPMETLAILSNFQSRRYGGFCICHHRHLIFKARYMYHLHRCSDIFNYPVRPRSVYQTIPSTDSSLEQLKETLSVTVQHEREWRAHASYVGLTFLFHA